MTVEVATTIATLNSALPAATDPKSEGDDHIRLIKTVLKANVVSGPASSTDNTLPRFDGTTGKLLQGSGVVVDDSGSVVIPATGVLQIGGASSAVAKARIYANTSGSTQAYDAAMSVRQDGTNHIAAWEKSGGVVAMTLDASGNLTLSAGALGYGAGAGGTVTQATSKSTAVTLNKPNGVITTHNAALAAATSALFAFNNSFLGDDDHLLLTVDSSTFGDLYRVEPWYTNVGIAGVRLTNISGGSRSDAVPIKFAVIKGSTT